MKSITVYTISEDFLVNWVAVLHIKMALVSGTAVPLLWSSLGILSLNQDPLGETIFAPGCRELGRFQSRRTNAETKDNHLIFFLFSSPYLPFYSFISLSLAIARFMMFYNIYLLLSLSNQPLSQTHSICLIASASHFPELILSGCLLRQFSWVAVILSVTSYICYHCLWISQ